jgi:hypothetical protein
MHGTMNVKFPAKNVSEWLKIGCILKFLKECKGRNRNVIVRAFLRETFRKNINWMPLCAR